MASVRAWCNRHGFVHQVLGDELFDLVPGHIREKLWRRKPVLADLARLRLMINFMERSEESVIWLDADSLVLDPSWRPHTPSGVSFGEEYWVDCGKGERLRHFRQPHNAFMMSSPGDPVLPFLEYLSLSMLERVQPNFVAPQMIGPKLLKTLHNLATFKLHPEAGALSPLLATDLASGGGAALVYLLNNNLPRPKILNLCGSLAGQGQHAENLDKITAQPEVINKLLQ